MKHVIVADTQDRVRNYCENAGLPRPGTRSDGVRSYALTPSSVKATRGLGAPLTIHVLDVTALTTDVMQALDDLRMVSAGN